MRTYETTIVINAGAARADYDGTLAAVKALYETEGAEFIEFEKWEERRLAYPIKGETSGLYFIGYFKATPDAELRIRRRSQLSDIVLRQLNISRDGKAYEAIRAQRAKAAAAAAAAAEEGAEAQNDEG